MEDLTNGWVIFFQEGWKDWRCDLKDLVVWLFGLLFRGYVIRILVGIIVFFFHGDRRTVTYGYEKVNPSSISASLCMITMELSELPIVANLVIFVNQFGHQCDRKYIVLTKKATGAYQTHAVKQQT